MWFKASNKLSNITAPSFGCIPSTKAHTLPKCTTVKPIREKKSSNVMLGKSHQKYFLYIWYIYIQVAGLLLH